MVLRSFFAATEISAYSRYGNSFVPKPPPTSGQITRIFSIGIFNTMPHRISRSRWLPWLPMVSVRWSRLASYSATAARVSMKLVMTRGLTIDTSATACAFAKAASVACLSPTGTSNSTLPGLSGQTCGAPCLTALTRPTTDGIGDHEGHGVADMAHLVLGEDRVWRAGEGIGFQVEQARQVAEIADLGRGQNQRHARHPAGLGDVEGEFRVRMRRAQHQRVHRRLWRMVVGIAAPAANQRVVFLAENALTDAEFDGSCHRISNSISA